MTTLVVRRVPSRPPQISLMRRCALAQAPCRTARRPASFAGHSGEIRRMSISPPASVASTSVHSSRLFPGVSDLTHILTAFENVEHVFWLVPRRKVVAQHETPSAWSYGGGRGGPAGGGRTRARPPFCRHTPP